MIGHIIAGKYQVLERIRRNALYDVYIARIADTDKRVVVKLFSGDYFKHEKTVSDLKPGLDNIVSLLHKNILSPIEYGEDDSSIYIIEEYFDGASLQAILEKATSISPIHALNQGMRIVEALAEAHSYGVVHGMLTPESVIVSSDLELKIGDFHSSWNLASALAASGAEPVWNARYCAPEVLAGETPTNESDVFSAGAILYELLSGTPCFNKDGTLSVSIDNSRWDVKSLREINSEVPRQIEAVILKCLEKDPKFRYDDARKLLVELNLCRAALAKAFFDASGADVSQNFSDPGAQTDFSIRNDANPNSTAGNSPSSQWNDPSSNDNFFTRGSSSGAEDTVSMHDIVMKGRNTGPFQTTTPRDNGDDSGDPPPAEDAEENLEDDQDMADSPPGKFFKEKNLPKGFAPFLIAFGVLIMLLTFCAYLLMGVLGIGNVQDSVATPLLTGKSIVEAKAILANLKADLTVEIIANQYSADIPEGYIITQNPEAGTKVKPGRIIEVAISQGQQKATVPKVTGLTIEQAKAILQKAGFDVGSVREEFSERLEAGQIISQFPEALEERYMGFKITLVISKGKSQLLITMPRATDIALEEAKSILTMNNITNIKVAEIKTGSVKAGTVVAQSVLEGAQIQPGKEVTLYAAQSPDPDADQEARGIVSLKVKTEQASQEVTIMVFDNDGAREAYRKTHKPGETVKVEIAGVGNTHVMVFFDGLLEKEQDL